MESVTIAKVFMFAVLAGGCASDPFAATHGPDPSADFTLGALSYPTKSSLPKCNQSREGHVGYVVDTRTLYVCSAGAWEPVQLPSGPAGPSSRILITEEPPGANCPEGGQKIEVGIDTNNNGVLDPPEVEQTAYICASPAAGGHCDPVAGTGCPPDYTCTVHGTCVPGAATYVEGPYGTAIGDIIEDLEFVGYVDGPDGDNDPFNEDARTWHLREFYAGNDPGAKVIMLNASAGWDAASQQEMSEYLQLWTEYGDCARLAVTVSADSTGDPATLDWIKNNWGMAYGLTIPTLLDPEVRLGAYFPDPAVFPMHVFIDAQTMRILELHVGADIGTLRSMFDYYCMQ